MNTNKCLFMDVHVLQTVPPSCVNRDDTGSPKTAIYGGVTRARVSSQCWKSAMRKMFKTMFSEDMQGKRTMHIVALVASEIEKLSPDAPARELAKKLLSQKFTIDKVDKDDKTKVLHFMSNAQAKALAELALSEPDMLNGKATKKQTEKLKSALKAFPSVDIALFGRMVANDPNLNNEACAQVAHSISTHRVSNEFDYFTAMDDCSAEDNAGAGHIDTVEFNSSTLYRYGNVAIHNLREQLGSETPAAVRGFLDAFVRSMPTGKQNTFANRTPADLVYVTFRHDQPVNLVGAFERPVKAGDQGYVAASKSALNDYAKRIYGDFVEAPAKAYIVGDGMNDLAPSTPFKTVLDEVEEIIRKECE